jgi:hypothetical protein
VAEGAYPRREEGEVFVEGSRWRIDFAPQPGEVRVYDSLIGEQGGEVIALNDSLQTWFPLRNRGRLAIEKSLFSFGIGPNDVSEVRVKTEPIAKSDEPSALRGSRVTFSYRIKIKVSAETVRGRVWGEFRVWASDASSPSSLPWTPIEIGAVPPAIQQALGGALSGIEGTPVRLEGEISRQLADGIALQLRITRALTESGSIAIPASKLQKPDSYRYQEPAIGVPGH